MRENGYDLEANLALLKLYQFNPGLFNPTSVFRILVSSSNCNNRGAYRTKNLLKVSQIKLKIKLNSMTSKKEAWVHATLREIRVKVLCSKLIKGDTSAHFKCL